MKKMASDTVLPFPLRNPHCSELELDNWIISEFIVTRLFPIVGVQPFPLDEQMLMTAAVCGFSPGVIFEWGTHIGKSARIFHEIGRAFSLPCLIHSIDLPDDVTHVEHPGQSRGLLVRNLDNVVLHQGDGLSISLHLHTDLTAGTRPLFFLDGDHSYDTVRRELTEILRMAPFSLILLHDTFYQSPGSGYNTGPRRAIQDIVDPARYKIIHTSLGLPGMTLVYPLHENSSRR